MDVLYFRRWVWLFIKSPTERPSNSTIRELPAGSFRYCAAYDGCSENSLNAKTIIELIKAIDPSRCSFGYSC